MIILTKSSLDFVVFLYSLYLQNIKKIGEW